MIVRCRTREGKWKRFKNVIKVERDTGWSSRIRITGECPCCNRPYNKAIDVREWSVKEEPPSEEDC